MSTELTAAIVSLESEVRALEGSREGSVDWYELQAKSLGLSLLRTSHTHSTPVDRLRRKSRKLIIEPGSVLKEVTPAPAPAHTPTPIEMPTNAPTEAPTEVSTESPTPEPKSTEPPTDTPAESTAVTPSPDKVLA